MHYAEFYGWKPEKLKKQSLEFPVLFKTVDTNVA